MWYVIVQSLSADTRAGTALFVPNQFTVGNYFQVFQLKGLPRAMFVSVSRTVLGTSLTVVCCMWMGFLFSKEKMPLRKVLYRALTLTMYISGGLIPTFLVMRSYGFVNSFLVYILPPMMSAFYVILIKTFVEQLPASVEESAMLDGAGPAKTFFWIIFPMSLPIVATIAVYASVAQWNAWFDNLIYNARTADLSTMQYLLWQYLNEAERLTRLLSESSAEIDPAFLLTPKGVRMTMTVVTIIPVMMIYPFLQRFFVKGIMIGAVKG
jgi:ABC-type glycerol-3-phosphate transport system permease component